MDIFCQLHEGSPEPRTKLAHTTLFKLLVAVILPAQAADVGVNKTTAHLYPVADTSEVIHAFDIEGLSEYIKIIDLYNSKTKSVIRTRRILIEKHGDQASDDRKGLEALPRVGRKAANVVFNTAFRQLAMAAGTHILHIANRTGIALGKNILEVEGKLLKFVPREHLLDAHHWLILHGRYVYKARKPQCGNYQIENLCEYKHKTSDD